MISFTWHYHWKDEERWWLPSWLFSSLNHPQVNGKDITHCPHNYVMDILKTNTPTLQLSVYREPVDQSFGECRNLSGAIPGGEVFRVRLDRQSGRSLGIKLTERRWVLIRKWNICCIQKCIFIYIFFFIVWCHSKVSAWNIYLRSCKLSRTMIKNCCVTVALV